MLSVTNTFIDMHLESHLGQPPICVMHLALGLARRISFALPTSVNNDKDASHEL